MSPNNFLTSFCGVRMPRIIYGTAWKKERTAALVEKAIKQGFRGIDTACQPKHYNEAGVGEGVAACLGDGLERGDLYLQTKFTPLDGQDPLRVPYDAKATLDVQVAQSFRTSLHNLKTDYLDCLVLHSPLPDARQMLRVWRAMEALFHDGGVKQLGLSNCYDLPRLEYLYGHVEVKPAVLQNRFYADTGYDLAIRQFCQRQRIIYQSFWTLTANPHVLAHATLHRLAVTYRRTEAQILFRYLSQIGIIPLTGTTSTEHMAEDLRIVEFELTPEDCQHMETLLLA